MSAPTRLLETTTEVGLSLPAARGELGNLYVLYYRTGMNPRPQELYFQREGTLQDVVQFAKHYCEKLNYRFVIVKRFLSNLEEDLKKFGTDGG